MASIGVLNETLADYECCWLKFNLADVKYIILQNDNDFEEICGVIDKISDNETTRRQLISKILIWDNAKEDF